MKVEGNCTNALLGIAIEDANMKTIVSGRAAVSNSSLIKVSTFSYDGAAEIKYTTISIEGIRTNTDYDCVFYPMLLKGTYAEDVKYEQFGASPSLEFPSEIETVSDGVEINVTNNDNTKSQTATMPIQQEMLTGDYIKNVEHHEWGKAILSGNEDVIIDGTYSGITQFKIAILNVKKQSNPSEICVLSNYFLGVEWNNSWTKNNSIVNRSDNSVRVMTSKYTTIDGFKAWLKSKYDEGNPVVIYYKLEKPINLELTSEQKAVRNQKLYTYKNITNISLSDELASIDVEYKKDLETEHNKLQNEIDEIKQLISTTETSALLLDNLQKDVESEVE